MKVISDLVTRYETGRLSRRDLIQGLTMLVATASAKGADEPAAATQLDCSGVDHVSVRVKDLKRSAEFYQSLFGLEPLGDAVDLDLCHVRASARRRCPGRARSSRIPSLLLE